jgi:glycerate dehydrogenase
MWPTFKLNLNLLFKMKIVVLDGYALNPGDLDYNELKKIGEVKVYDRTPYDKIIQRAQGAQIIFTNKTPIDEEILDNLPLLNYIGVLATGYDVVDTGYARQKGIITTNIPNYGTDSVAQFTFALLLTLCHRVQKHSDSVMSGKWSSSKEWCYWDYPLIELRQKTIGIIGLGTIGQKVADIAMAFGMNILTVERVNGNLSKRENIKYIDIPTLLIESDVVAIHCPLTPETKGLINLDRLKLMKKSAFLINTSRGSIIVEEDLAYALNNDIIAGAAIDVLSSEPPKKENVLFKAKNCVITPHIAWATQESREKLMKIAIENLLSFLNGRTLNMVD